MQALADRGAHVIMACRSLQRGASAAEVRTTASAAGSHPGCHHYPATLGFPPGVAALAQEVEAAQQSLPGCSPGRLEVAELDLNSLASVRRCGSLWL